MLLWQCTSDHIMLLISNGKTLCCGVTHKAETNFCFARILTWLHKYLNAMRVCHEIHAESSKAYRNRY